jgi:beta-glucosidase
VTSPETGNYAFELKGDGGARLWVDGKQLVDDWTEDTTVPHAARKFMLRMEQGIPHAIRVEYLRFQQDRRLEFGRRLSSMMQLAWRCTDGESLADALAAVKQADVVIAAVGITAELEGEEMANEGLPDGFRGGDRTSLDLPKPEEELIEAAKAAGKPLVLVLMNGSALSVNWAAEHANAILEAWYPGEEGGSAVAKTLSGANNPAGRLPVTFYRAVDDLPPFEDYAMANRTYRYFKGPVLYPFGFGLSYAKFRYSGMKLSEKTLKAGEPLGVDVEVENVSQVPGDEVAELYLEFDGQAGAPRLALRGFERVSLAAGSRKTVHFEVAARDLSWVDPDGNRVIAPGTVRVFVGGGQPGTGAAGMEERLVVQGSLALPE